VTEGHGVPEEVLLQRPLMVIQCILLLFEVLLYKASSVVIKVLKDKSLF
jgi:hypothetical protein